MARVNLWHWGFSSFSFLLSQEATNSFCGRCWFFGGVRIRESYLCTFWQESQHVFRKRMVECTSFREQVELNYWRTWVLLGSSSHPRIQTLEWRRHIFDWGFSGALPVITSFLRVDPWQRGARTSRPPIHLLGLVLHIGQSESERHVYLGSRVFFFSWKHNIYMTINRKSIPMSSQAYCLKLCSLWILLHISSFQLTSQGIFTENIIVSHNIVGDVFSPLTSDSLLPFSPCSCFLRRVWPEEEGWTITILRSLGKPSVPQLRELFSASPPFLPTLKQNVMKRWETLNFYVKQFLFLIQGRLHRLLCGLRLSPDWQAAGEQGGGTPMAWKAGFRDEHGVCFPLAGSCHSDIIGYGKWSGCSFFQYLPGRPFN